VFKAARFKAAFQAPHDLGASYATIFANDHIQDHNALNALLFCLGGILRTRLLKRHRKLKARCLTSYIRNLSGLELQFILLEWRGWRGGGGGAPFKAEAEASERFTLDACSVFHC